MLRWLGDIRRVYRRPVGISSTLAYRRALQLDKDLLLAHINLGWNLFLQGDIEAAIAAERAVLERQAHSTAQFNLGLFFIIKGQIRAAEAAYALGVNKFGKAEAVRVGAVKDLRAIRHTHPTAQRLLNKYWPEHNR